MITRDSQLTDVAVNLLPRALTLDLMVAALKVQNDKSIHVLISRWFLKSLILSKLAPNVFSSALPLYKPLFQERLVRQGILL